MRAERIPDHIVEPDLRPEQQPQKWLEEDDPEPGKAHKYAGEEQGEAERRDLIEPIHENDVPICLLSFVLGHNCDFEFAQHGRMLSETLWSCQLQPAKAQALIPSALDNSPSVAFSVSLT